MPRKKSIPRRRHDVRSDGVALPHRLVLPWSVEWDTLPGLTTRRQSSTQGYHEVQVNPDSLNDWNDRIFRRVELGLEEVFDLTGEVDSDDEDGDSSTSSNGGKKRSPRFVDSNRQGRKRQRRSASVERGSERHSEPRSRSQPHPRMRMGSGFQVSNIPAAGTWSVGSSLEFVEPLWDPTRATPAIFEWLDTKPCQDETLALRALHESGYSVESAVEWLKLNEATSEDALDPTIFDVVFEGGCPIQTKSKWFSTIAETLDTSTSQVIMNYLRWKSTKPEEYKRIVKKKKAPPKLPAEEIEEGKEHDYCAVCGDGGYLMECSGCRVAYHHTCLKLDAVPDGDWYCIDCENSKSGWKGSLKYLDLGPLSYLLVVPITPGKGLGLSVANNNNGTTVLEGITRNDVPSGFTKGDVIVGINQCSVRSKSYQEIVQRLKAVNGKEAVALELERVEPVSQSLSDDDDDDDEMNSVHPTNGATNGEKESTRAANGEKGPSVKMLGPYCYELRLPLTFIFSKRLELVETGKHVLLKGFDFPCQNNLPRVGDRLCAVNGSSLDRKTLNRVMALIGNCANAQEQVFVFAQSIGKPPEIPQIEQSFASLPVKMMNPITYEIRLPVSCVLSGLELVNENCALVLSKVPRQLTLKGLHTGDKLLSVNGTPVGSLSLFAESMGQAEYEKEQVLRFKRNSSTNFEVGGSLSVPDRAVPGATPPESPSANSPISINPLPGDLYEMHLPVRKAGLGISIAQRKSDRRVVLKQVLCSFLDPAQVGPSDGDTMMAVDGTQVEGMEFENIIGILKSHAGRSKRVIVWQLKNTSNWPSMGQSPRWSVGSGSGTRSQIPQLQNGTSTNPGGLHSAAASNGTMNPSGPTTRGYTTTESEFVADNCTNSEHISVTISSCTTATTGASYVPINQTEYEVHLPVGFAGGLTARACADGKLYLEKLCGELSNRSDELIKGDRITHINGIDVTGLAVKDALGLLEKENSRQVFRLLRCNPPLPDGGI